MRYITYLINSKILALKIHLQTEWNLSRTHTLKFHSVYVRYIRYINITNSLEYIELKCRIYQKRNHSLEAIADPHAQSPIHARRAFLQVFETKIVLKPSPDFFSLKI